MGNQRKTSNRLQGYDYTLPGAYFITLIAKDRKPLFGEMAGEHVHLSEIGKILDFEWRQTEKLRPEITLDSYVIMPNHFHAVLLINETFAIQDLATAHRRAPLRRQPRSLGAIIAGFKSVASQKAGRTYLATKLL